jgi:hypothetical protein
VNLRPVLARIMLVGGVVSVVAIGARNAPHDQSIALRLNGRDITHFQAVITRPVYTEATLGFSQSFPDRSPSTVRHRFSAPNGDYEIAITLRERSRELTGVANSPTNLESGGRRPHSGETSFERRVTLSGGEVVISSD